MTRPETHVLHEADPAGADVRVEASVLWTGNTGALFAIRGVNLSKRPASVSVVSLGGGRRFDAEIKPRGTVNERLGIGPRTFVVMRGPTGPLVGVACTVTPLDDPNESPTTEERQENVRKRS